ncbi:MULTISPECIES: 6-carboxyhexanoate--CoA ligase [Bacillus]|uniref:6-carboxyhexanoate--CoA ligase n=1 Tax=Bacillus licheniformis TaxID=1402 RepID=UPI0007791885|nr:6-carboxyhexanoate--CoA ligase [Bacillus licheniformis]ATI75021.1 6-carboxyhexanoate--CoA ligase [Bacillus licheniformis]KYC68082.1 Pimeloyl-CoA synthase [Bacillus licheniformis]MEC2366837.1 6-carboxyhexanoate--CoA ligase [Bacillus licheniformis]MEC3534338.1 6-carboxyhexanoate--CoA ligase [Bacillus licheniformis]MED0696188.1 6-carboxyhexanoate--CoA ligase [Bacillus licheniformis]
MKGEAYYSVRMRASENGPHEEGGKHISGGERLVPFIGLNDAVSDLLEKGMSHSRGRPDFMQIQFDLVNEPIKLVQPLRIETNETVSAEEGQALARELISRAGVPESAVEKAFQGIAEYWGVRGAVLFDIHSGRRIDGRKEKGVRVSRLDWPEADFQRWAALCGVPPNPRLKEALAIASKVCEHPAVIAELCWSDDPDYITGYVAAKKLGYQRMTKMKEHGDESGCRIFFVDGSADVKICIDDLEKQPVFIGQEVNHESIIR